MRKKIFTFLFFCLLVCSIFAEENEAQYISMKESETLSKEQINQLDSQIQNHKLETKHNPNKKDKMNLRIKEARAKNFNKDDFLIYFEGGIGWTLFGGLMNKEDSLLNPNIGVLYQDGSVQSTDFTYFNKRYAFIIERMISDRIGVGLGYAGFFSNRDLKAGGGHYEKKVFAKDKNYLEYKNLFAVLNWYIYKIDKFNASLIGRFGLINDGKYFFGLNNDGFESDFNGYNGGLGFGMNWIFAKHIFLGTNFIFTYNKINFKNKFTQKNLFEEKTDFTSIDWNFYLGIKI
ncbi:MAG: hypothetical protein LBF97_03205 [Elusimicrobiota bacterium]|jgi:hypothetical protein|nr:hypothetical protein [Elusimicrobiota bacterium]